MRVQEDIIETYKVVDVMSEEELRERLIELGQGPFLAGAPLWNLDQVNSLEDIAAVRKEEDESEDSESLELLPSACVRRTDWSEAQMRLLLKKSIYTVEAGQFFAQIDQYAVGSYANRRPLYPDWGSGAGSSPYTPEGGYALDRAALQKIIASLVDVAESNSNYPWSIPAEDIVAGKLDAAQYSDDMVRITCRELTYFQQTTVPSMWEGKQDRETEFSSPVSNQ